MRIPIVVALVGLLAISATAADPKPAFDAPFEARRAQFETAYDGASVVFVGSITFIGYAPDSFCGVKKSWQSVDYEIVTVLKGKLEGKTHEVHHLAIGGDGDQTRCFPLKPSLRDDWFRKGAQIIVFESKGFEPDCETAMPATAANLAAIQALAKAR